MKIEHLPQEVQRIGDLTSIGTAIGALLGWLPHIATVLTIVWMLIRISETRRFSQFINWLKGLFG